MASVTGGRAPSSRSHGATRVPTRGQIVPSTPFPETDLEEVAGCLRSNRKAKTGAQMRTAREREVIRRQRGGRC